MISLGKSNSIICDTISSIGIGLKKSHFPLIYSPSCCRTACSVLDSLLSDSVQYWTVCPVLDSLLSDSLSSIGQFVIGQFVQYWTVCYRTVFSIGQFVIGHFDKAISLKVVV